jgi:hypothetical protein
MKVLLEDRSKLGMVHKRPSIEVGEKNAMQMHELRVYIKVNTFLPELDVECLTTCDRMPGWR